MKLNKKNNIKLLIMIILWSVTTFSTFYMIYTISLWHDVENILRLVAVILLLLILAALVIISFKIILRKKLIAFIVFCVGKLFYALLILFIAFNVHQVYGKLKGITKNSITYSTSLVTINSDAKDIDSLTDGIIGIYSDEESIDGYILPIEIIEKRNLKNEIVYIDSYFEIIEQLENEEIVYAFMPTNFKTMFGEVEEYTETIEKIRIIYTEEKTVKIDSETKKIDFDQPITFLLMGIDSREANISASAFNGDALMVITFNPQTLNMTILSIPRDTYVPIACFSGERKNKITHAAWYGEKCMKETIENFLDLEIDYVVKMNFTGLVNLVDLVGGVEVEVPYSFCEQNSQSKWGKNTVYVMEGFQKLDGEQALAFSRNRKNNTAKCGYGSNQANDFMRGQHQQLVLRALMEKIKEIRNINTIQDILTEISTMMETNMQTNEILSFYNVFKDIFEQTKYTSVDDLVSIQRLYISGYDYYIHDYSQIHNQGTRGNLYNFVAYQGSIDDVKKAMKINLGLLEWERTETFSFNVNEPYQEKVIGKGIYQETKRPLLPNLLSYTLENIEKYANENNLQLEIEYVDNNGQYQNNQIISQFPKEKTDIEFVNKIIIQVAKTYSTVIDCSAPGKENCAFPNLVGLSYSEYLNIKKKYNLMWNEIRIEQTDAGYDQTKSLKVVLQSVAVGTDVYGILGQTVTIEYMAEYEEIVEQEE